MALGAQRSNVAALILRQGFVLAIIGVAIGFAASVAVRGILVRGLIGLGTLSPAVLAIVPIALLAVTMAACYLPAHRAAQIDPIARATLGVMIALLRGRLLEKHPNQMIVETGGVGYDVLIPISTFSALPEAGSEVRLRIYTHVREDALALFGFLTADEKTIFEKLISVSGIGPTLAIKVLSGLATPRSGVGHPQRPGGSTGAHPGRRQEDRRADGAGVEGQAGRRGAGARPAVPETPAARAQRVGTRCALGVVKSGLQALRPPKPPCERPRSRARPSEFEPLFRKALELRSIARTASGRWCVT